MATGNLEMFAELRCTVLDGRALRFQNNYVHLWYFFSFYSVKQDFIYFFSSSSKQVSKGPTTANSKTNGKQTFLNLIKPMYL